MMTQTDYLKEFLTLWCAGNGITAHTSGSTGLPKEILLPREQVERSARRTNRFFRITSGSRIHSAVSFRYIGGKMMIVRSLMAGCGLTFSEPALEPTSPGEPDISLMAVVPAQMDYIVRNPEKFGNVRRFLIGGSSISGTLWDRICAAGFEAWESYGMTETASHIALRRVAGPGEWRPRFVPMPGVEISTDSKGCLRIKDGEVFVETHDVASIASDGSFDILGRIDDVINTGGIKVFPQRIEEALRPFIRDLVQEFYVTSEPDELWSSRIVLVCVPEASLEDYETMEKALRERFAEVPEEKLPKRLLPKRIIFSDNLPLSPSGKIIRRLPE